MILVPGSCYLLFLSLLRNVYVCIRMYLVLSTRYIFTSPSESKWISYRKRQDMNHPIIDKYNYQY